MSVQGLQQLLAAFAIKRKHTEKSFEVGITRGALLLQRESQKIVPVDKDILRPTADLLEEGKGFKFTAAVFYATNYAIYVHENMEARHKPGKSAKFLEKPARQLKGRIGEIVRETMENGI